MDRDALLTAFGAGAADQEPLTRFLFIIVVWAALIITFEALYRLLRRLGWRTKSEIDDILVSEARLPMRLLLLLLALRLAVAPWVADVTGEGHIAAQVVSALARVGLVAVGVWLGYRIVRRVLLRYAESKAATTETMLDDMLLPMVRTLVAPVALGIGAVLIMEAAGLPVQSIALLVGGVSFILAFALRSTLEDIFGGVSLLVDTPFTYGDVLRLEDGSVVEVTSLGLRVTRLYDASKHAAIVIPNRVLSGERLMNMSRPTPDYRISVRVTVPGEVDPVDVEERLVSAAHGHPYVLGPAAKKLVAMRERMDRMVHSGDYNRAAQMIREMVRIGAESELNQRLDDLALHLISFSGKVHGLESGAFSEGEREDINAGLAELRRRVLSVQEATSIWLLAVRYTYVKGRRPPPSAEWLEGIERDLEAAGLRGRSPDRSGAAASSQTATDDRGDSSASTELRDIVDRYYRDPYFHRASSYARYTRDMVRKAMESSDGEDSSCIIGAEAHDEGYFALQYLESCLASAGFAAGLGQPSGDGIVELDDVEEYANLVNEWHRKVRALLHHVAEIEREYTSGSGVLLDEKLFGLRRWVASDFKEVLPRWKKPSASIVSVGDDLEYELKAYVDNVKLSHFTRVSKTKKQLHRDIVDLFSGLEPRISFAREELDVTLVNGRR